MPPFILAGEATEGENGNLKIIWRNFDILEVAMVRSVGHANIVHCCNKDRLSSSKAKTCSRSVKNSCSSSGYIVSNIDPLAIQHTSYLASMLNGKRNQYLALKNCETWCDYVNKKTASLGYAVVGIVSCPKSPKNKRAP